MKWIFKWLMYLVVVVIGIFAISLLVANFYKKEILAEINLRLKETVNGEVGIGDYNITFFHKFPNLSISLIDIHLYGPRYEVFHKPFLVAERIDVNIDAFRLFTKDIVIQSVDIEHGKLYVFRTFDGYTNTEVFKTRRMAGTGSSNDLAVIDLNKINLTDTYFTYQDSLKRKNFAVHVIRTENVLASTAGGSSIHVTGNLTFQELMLNPAKGSFLRNKSTLADFNIELDSTRKELTLKPSKLIFDKSTVLLSGAFQLNNTGKFLLNVSSEKMDYKEALTILADTISKRLARFDVDGPIKVKVKIDGRLEPGVKPSVDVNFSFNGSNVTTGKLVMKKTTVVGKYINHLNPQLPNDDTNSQLHFSTLTGKVNNLPVEAVVTLNNMKDPTLNLKARFDVDLVDLNENLDSTRLKLLGGKFVSEFTYAGKLREYLDETSTSYEGKLQGRATITNGRFQYNRKQIRVEDAEGEFRFNEKQFDIKSLSFKMNKNAIAVTGKATDFIPFFVNPKTSGKVRLAITSPKLDLTGMLKSRSTSTAKKARSKKRMSDMIDHLSTALDMNLDFNIKQFVNAKFKASQMKGRLQLANDQLVIKDLTMNFAGGQVEMNLNIDHMNRKISPVHIDANVEDVGLKQFFYCFNDFNQTTFRHEHVDGKLDLDINLHSELNDKFELLMPNLTATANFTIQDGSLKDFEPMQRLSNFLLKGRDFSDVKFSDVGTRIAMRGTRMEVSRMEIESTVLTMFIEGMYDLKENSDLSIQVPLSNLKKRSQDFAPENIGVDAKVGASVFLRVKPDKNGKTTISYDPFKKLRKKKKGDKSA